MLAGVDSRWLVAPLGTALAELLLAGRYGQVVAVVRHLMLGFAAFGVAVLAHPDWPACSPPAWSRARPAPGQPDRYADLESLLGAMISAIRRGQQLLRVVIGHLH